MLSKYLLKWPPELEAACRESAAQAHVTLAAWIRSVLWDATIVHPSKVARGGLAPAQQDAGPATTAAPSGAPPVKRRDYPPLAQTAASPRAAQLIAERLTTAPRSACCGALITAGKCGICRNPV